MARVYKNLTIHPMNRKRTALLQAIFITLLISFLITPTTQAQSQIDVVVETRILPFDTQSGMKSRQKLSINFDSKKITSNLETGITDFNIPGITDLDIAKLKSARDNFKVRDEVFSKDKVSFIATGQTASGIKLLPNIDYYFKFTVWKDGKSTIRGCHDGYPAYSIKVSDESQYSYEHEPGEVGKLIGECDIVLPEDQIDRALTIQSTQIVHDGAGTGAIILEASSIHAAVRLYYENPKEMRTEGAVYAVMPVNGKNKLPRYAVTRRAFAQAIAGEGALGRVSSSLTKGQFGSLKQPLTLPGADFRFIIRADSQVLQEVDRALNSKTKQLQDSFDSANYRDVMRATAELLQTAISAAPKSELQMIINSKGDRLPLPSTSNHKSGLSWLYSYALQSESQAGLADCKIIPSKPEEELLNKYLELLKTANESRLVGAAALGHFFGGFGYSIYPADISRKIAQLLLTSVDVDRYSEFLALGHLDPTRVDLARCKGIRFLRGKKDPIAHVIERSEVYRVASELIAKSRPDDKSRPLFFDAARAVTRLIGVGLVDLADDMRLYNDTLLVKASRDLFVSDKCFPAGSDILPNPADRAFLRKVNAELLTFNQPRMQRLIQSPNLLFDPVSLGPFNPPIHYQKSPALWFDLRMVQAEQGHVEKLVKRAGITPGSARDVALTTAELSLRCLATGRTAYLLGKARGSIAHLKIIADVDKALSKLRAAGVMSAKDQNFSNETWRVAIGSAFVFALHQQKILGESDWLVDYVNHVKRLLSAKTVSRSDIPRTLQNRINGILQGAEERWPVERVVALSNATTAYLTENKELSLYKCEGAAPTRSLSSDANHLWNKTVSQRIQSLSNQGVQAIALPFELRSKGGALQSDLMLSSMNDRERFCQALDTRHVALECAVSRNPKGDCSAGALRLSDRSDGAPRFLFMRASIGLREDLGHLGAFLFEELSLLPKTPTLLEVETSVKSAVERERMYKRNLSLAAIIAGQSVAIRKALGVETDDKFWDNLLKEALPEGPSPIIFKNVIDQDKLKKLQQNISISNQVALIKKLEKPLNEAIRPITITADDSSNSRAIASVLNPELVASGTKNASTLSNLAALGDSELGLGFELQPISSEADGIAKFQGVLIYRRASTTAGAEAACVATNTNPCPVSSSMPLTNQGEQGRLALGLEVGPLAFDSAGELIVSSTLGKADIVYRPEQTRAALYALGMPRSIGLDTVQFDLEPDLKSINMLINLKLAGLPKFLVTIPVVKNGEMVDFEETARGAIEKAASDWLRTQSSLLTFDANLSPSANLPIGLSLKKDSLVPTVDWHGGAIIAEADFDFYIGLGANREVFLAEAAITISSGGVDLHGLSFNPKDPKALMQAIQRIPPFSKLAEIAEHVSIIPEFADGNLSLLIRASPIVEGCALPIEERINLADPEAGIKVLRETAKTASKELMRCQVERKVGALFEELSGGSIDIFSLQMDFDFEKLRTGDELLDGRVVVPAEFPVAQFDGCEGEVKPTTFELPNFALNLNPAGNSFGIDLGGLELDERRALGAALHCKILNSLGDLSNALKISNVEVGRNILAADIKIPGLPFIGDLVLPRINFLEDLNKDLVDILEEQLKATAGTALRSVVADLVGESFKVPGVGKFTPSWSTASFDLFKEKKITIPGRMLFANKYDLGIELILPLSGDNLSGFKIRTTEDPGSIIAGQLTGLLSGILPFPGPIEIINPRIAQLDDRGFRWGLVFGMKINIDLAGQGFKIKLNRIAISADGIDMDQEIRMAMNTPMYFPPVALSKVLIIYKTGADGGSKGLSIGADLTAVEPSLANVLKIEAILDLRDAKLPKLVLEGDLIAFGSISLLESYGEINLKKGQRLVSFKATTTDAIRDIINAAADGKIDGEEKLVMASTKIAILGIDLQQTEMHFCTKPCDPIFPDGGSAKLKTVHSFPFGPEAQLEFQTDLEFRNPSLGAGVGLNLFGWEPGRAQVNANKKFARLALKFLGIEVGITTPTLELLSPSYITDILLSLLDIDLEALLKLPPKKIEISLMQGDGSTQTVADGSSEGANDESSEGGEKATEEGREGVPPGKQSGPREGQPPKIAEGPKKGEENSTGPNQPFWGRSVDGIFCEEVASPTPNGPASARKISPKDRYQIWARNFENASEAISPLFKLHPHPMPTWHSPTLSGSMAVGICVLNDKKQLLLRDDVFNVGVARIPIGGSKSCNDNVPEFRYYRLNPENDEHKKQFTNAQRSVLCYETENERFDIEARLFWRSSDNKYLAVLYCPSVGTNSYAKIKDLPGYQEACGNGVGVIVLDNPTDCTDGCTILSDITELKLIEDRLRGFLQNNASRNFSYDLLDEGYFKYGGARVDFRQVPIINSNGEIIAHRFELGIETDRPGILQIENLRLKKPTSKDLGLWPWMQPDRAGIRNEILKRWLAKGRLPSVIASFPKDGWLVLRISGTQDRETQLWLNDGGKDILRVVTLMAPNRPPQGAAPFSGERREKWLAGLLPLIEKLPSKQTKWHLSLGVADKSNILTYAFRAKALTAKNDLMVHLHSYDLGGTSIWVGGKARIAKTICTESKVFEEKLRESAIKSKRALVTFETALEDLDSFSVEMGLDEHAIGILTSLGGCNG